MFSANRHLIFCLSSSQQYFPMGDSNITMSTNLVNSTCLPGNKSFHHYHGGTTEEGNCSYLLPRAAAVGSKRHKYGPNTGILVCLVREIWQFKVFAGKEVTALPATHGEGGYWRWGRRLLCLCFFKTLEIKWLRTFHWLVIRTSKLI